LVIFATIFGVGFVILIVSLLSGGDAGHGIDAGVDADTDLGHIGPGIISVKMIALVMIGFGAFSFGVRSTTEASMFLSSMAGVGGAIVIGFFGYLIIRGFYSSQASSTISEQDIIGASANLIDAIPKGGLGQVACILRGREITYMARSRDGRAIGRGTIVRIIGKSGNSVIVEPMEKVNN
jgi:membrane protein implicated in regulation of membrane protease activity